ncbi:hypothetical protein [Bradyrhizobium sp. Gha]|nr:hypothetical protein [Bradyrhizobium sp. Gha]
MDLIEKRMMILPSTFANEGDERGFIRAGYNLFSQGAVMLM